MIELGIDEYTVVLQLSKLKINMLGIYDWYDIAQKIINQFATVADLYNVFGEKITVPFEFFHMEILARYDEILKTNYGDYMTFPPVEERGRWHDTVFEPDMPYEIYCSQHNV